MILRAHLVPRDHHAVHLAADIPPAGGSRSCVPTHAHLQTPGSRATMNAFALRRPQARTRTGSAGRWGWRIVTIARGQDKSGSPAEPQAIDMAWVLACRSVGARATLFTFSNDFKGIFGTVWHLVFAEVLA